MEVETLNLYGDVFTKTSGAHGSDISFQRIDELDKASLKQVCLISEAKVLDIGCGLGGQSVRFAMLGANVTAIDIIDSAAIIEKKLAQLGIRNDYVNFQQKDIFSYFDNCTDMYNIVYSQRFIHYLPYDLARKLVECLYNHLERDGYVFISASGMTSELSKGYDSGRVINERFSRLEHKTALKHGILTPVCLYYKEELQDLFVQAGFTTLSIWTSSFGNIKAIFKK